jgi:hypothetical protein
MFPFYEQIRAIDDFNDLNREDLTHSVPADWSIVITDVVNSTIAIEQGRYKDVNIAGGLAAMALSNYFQAIDHPFVFGGDGITFLIPNKHAEVARSLLADTRRKILQLFDLNLRVGIVPMTDIRSQGGEIRVGKWKVSDYYTQAIFNGNGIALAESWVKIPESRYTITDDEPIRESANFEGFTCRWKDIPSKKGETVSLIVEFPSFQSNDAGVRKIFTEIQSILGAVEDYHPLEESNMNYTSDPSILLKEAVVHANSLTGFGKYLQLLRIYIESYLVRFCWTFGVPIKAYFYILKDIKKFNKQSSDFRKFDGSLKMVVSVDTKQREKLTDYLDQREKEGKIRYGIHVSDRALLTCIMHANSATEVHFVDAADGGYAMAAKQLKWK